MLLINNGQDEYQYGFFSPPEKALMNVLSTPQLNFSESIKSLDYQDNENRAKFGFGMNEDSIFTNKFRIESD